MKSLFNKSGVSFLLFATACGVLFIQQYLRVAWLEWLPPWVPSLGAAAAIFIVYPRLRGINQHIRTGIITAGLLVVAAGVLVLAVKEGGSGLTGEWRRNESRGITSVMAAVGERIEGLLEVSTGVGQRTSEFVRTSSFDEGSMEFRLEAFRELGALSEQIRKEALLPAGTEIGIQLFDTQGNRIAWAGWPQAVEKLEYEYISSGRELIYTRQVSLYRILTHIIPVNPTQAAAVSGGDAPPVHNTRARGNTEKLGTVLIDMPLEVNYKVNNKFLKSSSLADDIAGGAVAADVRFDYYASDAGMSAMLGGLERRPENRPRPKKRQRLGDKKPAGDETDPSTPLVDRDAATEAPAKARAGDEKELSPARSDSTDGSPALPASVERVGGVSGNETTGLAGRAVIRTPLGNALFNVTVVSPPFSHYVESRNNRIQFAASLFILVALLIGFALSLEKFPRQITGPLQLFKAAYLIAVLALVRYALLWFQPTILTSQLKVFEPAIFATPIFGGLMRSAGDLLITAVFFVVALYGVLKITRDKERRREEPPPDARFGWLFAAKGLAAAAAIVGVFELARRFVGSVVLNANPRLVGETVGLFEPQILVLHLSTFLMVGSIFLTGMMCAWGFYRIKGRSNTGKASSLAAIAILAVSVIAFRWDLLFISLLVLLFVVFAPRIVQREDLVSIVITAFGFVVIVSATAYVFFNQEYQGLRRTFIQEKVAEVTHPSDNWKVFILEDILENLSQDPAVKQILLNPGASNVQRIAFDLWADSPLSLLGYSCAIYVFDEADSLVSRFAVEMPYRLRAAETGERMETTSTEEWVVLDLTTQTPQGAVRFYRGIVNMQGQTAGMVGLPVTVPIGKIVVDIPFFFENLTWAARTGPRTPEVLRNVQEGGIAPRLEETEAILLARLRGTRVVESSSEVLPVGYTIDTDALSRAIDLDWPLLSTGGMTHRYLAQETDNQVSYLLAGFPVPSPSQHVLRWSTILSLYFFFTVALIALIILLKRLPVLGDVLPTLTPGRQLGFQQKLLGSFLIIALLPAVILGVFTVRMIKERFVEESRKEAVYRAESADKSLDGVLVGELHGLIDRYDLSLLVDGAMPPFYAHDPTRRAHVFKESDLVTTDTGAEGSVRMVTAPDGSVSEGSIGGSSGGSGDGLQEGFGSSPRAGTGDGGVPEAYRDIALHLDEISPEQVFVHWIGNDAFFGVVSHPITIVSGDNRETLIVYCARRVDSELLGEIAGRVGADVSLFDGGVLVAASREGLLSGGFISATMDSDAFVRVSVMGVDQTLVNEKAGRYSYQVAYIPVVSLETEENAAIGVPLLFRPESYSVEVEKATSIVLSIFALLSAATIGLGLLLARGIFEPLKGLLEGTKRIARGDFSFKLPTGRHDEIGTVVEAFNEMTSQVSESQAALEERRRYLEAILVNIGTGVITTDSDDRIRAANDAAERILGCASSDLIGKTAEELGDAGVSPEFFSKLEADPVRPGGAGAADSPVEGEIDIIKDGHKRTIKTMHTRLSAEERYLGTVIVFEDLTELISSKKLSAWVEMSRQIAHEIKNPLTPIKLSAQFMVRAHEEKSADFDKIFRESADTIIQQVDVLRNISREFSSFGRLQQLHLEARPVVPLLREIVAPYERNTSGVNVSFAVDGNEPAAILDPEALRKICTNLIENAMESMPGGGDLSILCDVEPLDGEEMVRITVTDTGPGLDEDTAERLFEPYFSTKTTGTGLGLAICRNLSREMGGDVTVENLPNRAGVKATLYLKSA